MENTRKNYQHQQSDDNMRKIDRIGRRYGRWVVLHELPRRNRFIEYICLCECGSVKRVTGISLGSGKTKSCGCISSKTTAKRNFRHGMRRTRLYNIWSKIIDRCTNPSGNRNWLKYGARGIDVSNQWLKFETFYKDMGQSYKQHVKRHGEKNTSIDRIDNQKGYSLDNCRWATPKEQARNMRSNRILQFKGKNLCLLDVANKIGVPYQTLQGRLNRGWEVSKAIYTPIRKGNYGSKRTKK